MTIRELALYIAAFFGTLAFSHLAARLGWSWPDAIRFLSTLAGA